MNAIAQIKRLVYAQPFKPFGIELSSGRVIKIGTPDHIAFRDSGDGWIAYLEDDGTFDAVSAAHINVVGTASAGKSKKRR
jgi:hypothetical protein